MVVWFDVIGGNHTVEAEGVDSVWEAIRRADELGGIWFPAEMVDEVIEKLREAAET